MKKYKQSIIFAIIASSISIVMLLIGIIYFANMETFSEYFNYLITINTDEGATIIELINELNASGIDISLSEICSYMYIGFLIGGLGSVLLTVPSLVLAIINLKDCNLPLEEFNKKNKLHVWFIVTVGIAFLNSSNEMASSIVELLSIFALAAEVLFILAIIFSITSISKAKKEEAEEKARAKAQEEAERASYNQVIENKVIDEKPYNEEEKVSAASLKKQTEMYELLSKLEKSYKNNEVSLEDYQRMKETILDNYLNKE